MVLYIELLRWSQNRYGGPGFERQLSSGEFRFDLRMTQIKKAGEIIRRQLAN